MLHQTRLIIEISRLDFLRTKISKPNWRLHLCLFLKAIFFPSQYVLGLGLLLPEYWRSVFRIIHQNWFLGRTSLSPTIIYLTSQSQLGNINAAGPLQSIAVVHIDSFSVVFLTQYNSAGVTVCSFVTSLQDGDFSSRGWHNLLDLWDAYGIL